MTTPNQRLDVKAIKAEICRLRQLSTRTHQDWVRLFKLSTIRASMRGKVAFAPGSNLAELYWTRGLGAIKCVEIHFKTTGAWPVKTTTINGVAIPTRVFTDTKRRLGAGQVQETVYRYATISKKLQAAWVTDVAREFTLPTKTGRDQAREALDAFEKERASA